MNDWIGYVFKQKVYIDRYNHAKMFIHIHIYVYIYIYICIHLHIYIYYHRRNSPRYPLPMLPPPRPPSGTPEYGPGLGGSKAIPSACIYIYIYIHIYHDMMKQKEE